MKKTTITSFRLATLGIALLASATNSKAQILYGTSGSTYTENFSSGLPATGNVDWDDNSTFAGFYAYQSATSAAPEEYRKTSSGDSTLANLFQWRPASSTDGALGTKPNDSTGTIATGVRFTNTTGLTLTQFSLGYTGEQWFSSNANQNNQLVVAYQLGSPANLLDGTWTTIPALQFSSIFNDGTVRNLDGSLPANQTVLSPVTVSGFSWANGTDLYIRWFDANSAGADQGLAIDDVNFTAVPEPSTYALLIAGGIILIAFRRRAARA